MTTENADVGASADARELQDQRKNEEAAAAEEEIEIEWQPDALPEQASVTMVVAEGAESTLEVGKQVEVVGTPRNGSLGLLETFLAEKGRWKVQFDSGASNNFKPENLRVVKLLGASVGTVRREAKAPQEQEVVPEAATSSDQKPTIEVGLLTDVLRLMKKTNSLLAPEDEEDDALRLPRRKLQPNQVHKQASQATAPPKAAEKELPVSASKDDDLAETSADDGGVVLAGKRFPTQRSLVEHIKAVQAKMDERDQADGPSDGVLAGEDMFLLYHLVMQHPKTAEKLRAPLKALRYGTYRKMKNKCFMLVFVDGSEEPISWNKSVKDIFNQGSKSKRPLPEDAEQDTGEKRAKAELAELY